MAGRAGQLETTEKEPKRLPGTALSKRNRMDCYPRWKDRCANWGEHRLRRENEGQEGPLGRRAMEPRTQAPADTAGHTLQGAGTLHPGEPRPVKESHRRAASKGVAIRRSWEKRTL